MKKIWFYKKNLKYKKSFYQTLFLIFWLYKFFSIRLEFTQIMEQNSIHITEAHDVIYTGVHVWCYIVLFFAIVPFAVMCLFSNVINDLRTFLCVISWNLSVHDHFYLLNSFLLHWKEVTAYFFFRKLQKEVENERHLHTSCYVIQRFYECDFCRLNSFWVFLSAPCVSAELEQHLWMMQLETNMKQSKSYYLLSQNLHSSSAWKYLTNTLV